MIIVIPPTSLTWSSLVSMSPLQRSRPWLRALFIPCVLDYISVYKTKFFFFAKMPEPCVSLTRKFLQYFILSIYAKNFKLDSIHFILPYTRAHTIHMQMLIVFLSYVFAMVNLLLWLNRWIMFYERVCGAMVTYCYGLYMFDCLHCSLCNQQPCVLQNWPNV